MSVENSTLIQREHVTIFFFLLPSDFVTCIFPPLHYFLFNVFISFFNFINLFLLVFNLPTYRITPSAHPIKCPSQCLSPSHPHPSPTSPSTPPSSFPRVRSLSCSVSLSDISHSFFLLSPLFPFTIFYIPQMNETV